MGVLFVCLDEIMCFYASTLPVGRSSSAGGGGGAGGGAACLAGEMCFAHFSFSQYDLMLWSSETRIEYTLRR
jgi:hypothetical protein